MRKDWGLLCPQLQRPELCKGAQKPLVKDMVFCGKFPTTNKEAKRARTGLLRLCSRRPIHCEPEYAWHKPSISEGATHTHTQI